MMWILFGMLCSGLAGFSIGYRMAADRWQAKLLDMRTRQLAIHKAELEAARGDEQ